MTKHQYQALSGQIAAWGMLILSVVCTNVWISGLLLGLAAVQTILNCYWHEKAKETP